MICAIVVTYNRKQLLERCIKALLRAAKTPDRIYVIDNASTDGTGEFIHALFKKEIGSGVVRYHLLPENIGGAGGFHEGLSLALNSGGDYFWLMDDDAEPEPGALRALTDIIDEDHRDDTCLVSLATDREKNMLSWGTGVITDQKTRIFDRLNDLPFERKLKAPWAPFLGFLIPRKVVERIGLPRKDYFIWGDDVEYSSRIWDSGREIYYVRESIIYHPVLEKIRVSILGREVVLINAEDWKQYYGMRNDVYTLSRQKRFSAMLKRILFYFLVWKARGMRLRNLHFYVSGLYHGLIGRLGRYPN